MEKIIYLHIGTFKTGTSSIQQYLNEHSEKLNELGYFVPKGQLIGHHDLPISLIKEFTDFRASWPAFNGDRESIWQNIFSQIENSNSKKIILSSENFCDLVNEHARVSSDKMGQVLKRYFKPYKVKIIVYLRNLAEYQKSMYGEMIKVSDSTLALDKLLASFIKHKSIHMHPSLILDYYANLFGKTNLITKIYSRKTLINGDVVSDFLSCLGIDVAHDNIPNSEKHVNLSLYDDTIKLKRIFNLAGIKDHEFNKRIANTLIALDDILGSHGNNYFSDSVLNEIRMEHDCLLKNYGIKLEEKVTDSASLDAPTMIEGALISLLAISIRQNRVILSRIADIENLLMKNTDTNN